MAIIIITLVVCISAIWVYLDTTKHNIGHIEGIKGFLNMSAGAWATVTLLLWIIGFPVYLSKRNTLIALAKDHPVFVSGRAGKVVLLCVIGGLWLSWSFFNYMAGSLPRCDDPEVVSLAEKVIKNSPIVKITGLNIKGISIPAEKSYDADAEKRVCRAMLNYSEAEGEESIQYSVEWHDKKKGLIWVEVLPD